MLTQASPPSRTARPLSRPNACSPGGAGAASVQPVDARRASGGPHRHPCLRRRPAPPLSRARQRGL